MHTGQPRLSQLHGGTASGSCWWRYSHVPFTWMGHSGHKMDIGNTENSTCQHPQHMWPGNMLRWGHAGSSELDLPAGVPADHRHGGMDAIGAVPVSGHLYTGSSGLLSHAGVFVSFHSLTTNTVVQRWLTSVVCDCCSLSKKIRLITGSGNQVNIHVVKTLLLWSSGHVMFLVMPDKCWF